MCAICNMTNGAMTNWAKKWPLFFIRSLKEGLDMKGLRGSVDAWLTEATVTRMTNNTSEWLLSSQRPLFLSLLWSYGEFLS